MAVALVRLDKIWTAPFLRCAAFELGRCIMLYNDVVYLPRSRSFRAGRILQC